jgi:hypothetical protein
MLALTVPASGASAHCRSLGAMARSSRYCVFVLATLLAATVAASAQELTVMELLQNPRQFEGRRVTVRGYYYGDFEGHGLFADRKAAKEYDTKKAIWVSADPNVESPICKGTVIGVFSYSRPNWGYGMFGLYSAAVVNATVHLKREATPAPNPEVSFRRSPE